MKSYLTENIKDEAAFVIRAVSTWQVTEVEQAVKDVEQFKHWNFRRLKSWDLGILKHVQEIKWALLIPRLAAVFGSFSHRDH